MNFFRQLPIRSEKARKSLPRRRLNAEKIVSKYLEDGMKPGYASRVALSQQAQPEAWNGCLRIETHEWVIDRAARERCGYRGDEGFNVVVRYAPTIRW